MPFNGYFQSKPKDGRSLDYLNSKSRTFSKTVQQIAINLKSIFRLATFKKKM